MKFVFYLHWGPKHANNMYINKIGWAYYDFKQSKRILSEMALARGDHADVKLVLASAKSASKTV